MACRQLTVQEYDDLMRKDPNAPAFDTQASCACCSIGDPCSCCSPPDASWQRCFGKMDYANGRYMLVNGFCEFQAKQILCYDGENVVPHAGDFGMVFGSGTLQTPFGYITVANVDPSNCS